VALRSRRGELLDGHVLRTELRADAVTEELLAKVAFKAVPRPLPPIGERAEVTVRLPALPEGPEPAQRCRAAPGPPGRRLDGGRPSPALRAAARSAAADLDGHVQVLSKACAPATASCCYSEKALEREVARPGRLTRLPGAAP
jgi:HlyD family secretion protein